MNDNEMLETESVTTLDPFKQSSTHSASPLKQTLMQDESDESHSLMHSYTSSAHCLSHCSFELEFVKSVCFIESSALCNTYGSNGSSVLVVARFPNHFADSFWNATVALVSGFSLRSV